MRIADYFDGAAAQYPNNLAFVDGQTRIDFAEAQRTAHAIAHALVREKAAGCGTHVAIYAPNDYRVTLLHLGINLADMAWLSVHIKNTIETNAEVLEYFDADIVFFHSQFASFVPVLKTRLSKARLYVCIDGPSEHGISMQDWLAGCWTPFCNTCEQPGTVAFLQPTGGTTGPSKGAVHTHRTLEMMGLALATEFTATPESRHLVIAPLTHAAGLIVLGFAARGCATIILPGFDADAVFNAIEKEKVSHLFLPPTAVYALLAHPRAKTTDFSSLRCFIVGAAPIAPEKFKEAVRVFGPIMYEGFGQTETLIPILVKRPSDYLNDDGSFDEAAVRAAGKPVGVVRVGIMDTEGNLLPAGERGEIVVRSSMTMQGYYKKPEETAAVSTFGWHHTSDVGVVDERGFVTIVDRIKDMIVSGGFNIYPVEIEKAIQDHPAVLDCIVVGVPDEKWGEAVKAVVQLKPGQTLEEAELIAICKAQLGSAKAPKTIEFWDTLPRSAVGKLLKKDVRAKFWGDQWRSV
ncbi:AMP-binding protein [Variovorax sp. J31P179]|uniref:class I adenylate-forming enzyme family protein n=1 Tax=Variovorax sp. J31P179 TaxID=3053508 RepID=UPI002576E706|nr:AMP-binding protein [Variovorax sp. J31P179]MDM0084902.1 AMP-binding protein [Variovorax sp. J31P179]